MNKVRFVSFTKEMNLSAVVKLFDIGIIKYASVSFKMS